MNAVVEATLARWFSQAFIDTGGAEAVRQRLLSDDVSSWAIGWRAISELDNATALKTLGVPALCVAGECDRLFLPRQWSNWRHKSRHLDTLSCQERLT
jgi:3-oxoadipate enol-lactonase